tara:strand:+ start:7068 stop:8330 length:1263 start_codon:yes stop_codon:yes gene_type:complete
MPDEKTQPYQGKAYLDMAREVASRGRYGDSMLMHVNPIEVAALEARNPGTVTINPDTGQPEAFLQILLPILKAVAAPIAGLGAFLAPAAGATGPLAALQSGLAFLPQTVSTFLGAAPTAATAGAAAAPATAGSGLFGALGGGGTAGSGLASQIGHGIGSIAQAPFELIGQMGKGLGETLFNIGGPESSLVGGPESALIGGEETVAAGFNPPPGTIGHVPPAPPVDPSAVTGGFPYAAADPALLEAGSLPSLAEPGVIGAEGAALTEAEAMQALGGSDLAAQYGASSPAPSPGPTGAAPAAPTAAADLSQAAGWEGVQPGVQEAITEAIGTPRGGLAGAGDYLKSIPGNIAEGFGEMSFQQKVMALYATGMGIDAAIQAAQDEPWENSESSYAGPSSWEGRGSATFPSAGRTSSSEWNFYA